MGPMCKTTIRTTFFWSVVVFMVTLAVNMRLFASRQSYSHPDEIIAEKVVNNMIRNRNFDSNWADIGLPESFDYPQFNFSGYHVVAAFWFRIVNLFTGYHDVSNSELRTLSGTLWVLGLIGIIIFCRLLFGHAFGLVGGALYLFNPLVFQDSLYARPESYVVFMTIVCFGLFALDRGNKYPLVLLGSVIIGNLVATKISFLPFALVALAWILSKSLGRDSNQRLVFWEAARKTSSACAGIIIGFLVSVPYGLLEPDEYLHGFQVLSTQYTTGHWPHGLPDSDLLGRTAYAANYFLPTMGVAFFFLAVFGLVIAIKTRQYGLVFLGATLFIVFLQFASYPTFFERNFSHLVVLSMFLVVYALSWVFSRDTPLFPRPKIAKVIFTGLTVLLILPPMQTTLVILTESLSGNNQRKVDVIRADLETKYGYPLEVKNSITDQVSLLSEKDLGCLPNFIDITDYGDEWTQENIRLMQEQLNYDLVLRVPSLFVGISTSTLQTYFSAGHVFMLKRSVTDKTCAEVSPVN